MTRSTASRYAVGVACVSIAALLHISPLGPLIHPMGFLILGVVAVAWGAASYWKPHADLGAPMERERVEERLRQSEDRHARAMAAAQAGFWDWDLAKDEYYVSPSLLRMIGVPPGTTFASRSDFIRSSLFTPETFEKYQQAVKALFESGGSRLSWELRAITDGETRWFNLDGMCFRDEADKVERWTGSVTDITERKRAEDALRLAKDRYELAMRASGAGHWDWKIESDEYYVSPRYLEFAGIPPDFQYSRRADIVSHTPFHPDDRAAYEAAVAAHFAGETPRVDMVIRVVPNGVTHWLHMIGMCSRDADGKPVRYAGSVTDITARKLAEQGLRSRQELLELAQKSARAVAFGWSADRDEPWPEELEAMYGVAPGNLPRNFRPPGIDRDGWKEVVHPDDWDAVDEAVRHSYRTGEIMAEYRVVHADASVHWLQCKGRMFFDAEKKPVRVVGLIQDVTQLRHAEQELKTLERKLRQAQRLEAMGTLAGGIAHDFNNILGAILGYGEMAQRDAPKGSRLARDLDNIIVAGERGRALVDRVLAFSRSGVGERVPVHVEKVVREALDLVSATLPPDVAVHAELDAGRAAMLGDATQVHQVLMNLTTNAIHAMPAGGTLRVSLRAARFDAARAPTIGILQPGDYVVLEVADSGTGIASDILDRIFDPFFTTKEVGTGTGLGLSLVHGIVAEVGGAIDVASKPGAGSTFTVYLPRSGDAQESPQKEDGELPRGVGQRVLVVDDEEPLVALATRTLEELGYVPVGFTSSTAALAAFRADPQRFDALITDERMPGMSGAALIREVRGIRGRIPVVLMSGYVGGAIATHAREAGAEEVLQKPLVARDLATSLARVLQS